ncbi:MAG: LTA synthase family protein [Bacteroidales bacterium]|nr:LTA synthase family protein [Bacteroidales bacterium]
MTRTRLLTFLCGVVVGTLLGTTASAADPARKTENVIVVTLDGFRWQELFGGADESFMDSRQGGVRDVAGLKARYLRKTVQERRETLMPFLWTTIAKKGQIFGNPAKNAAAKITNPLKFSYPGYSELFCGLVDPRIDSNGKKNNPNLSVFEFLHNRPGFQNRVEAVCTWDVFPYILRSQQNGLRVHSGWEPIQADQLTAEEHAANATMAMLPHYWPGNSFDVVATDVAKTVLQRRKPRVLYLGLGETDEWGHGRRYDLYLDAARNADQYLARLWDGLQKEPQYRDKTALLITTDHGRGSTRADWTDHGKNVAGAEFIWMAVIGPDTPALGERENVQVTQSQVAATIAALLGEDFQKASPKAADPLPVFGSK